jgi:hypothetical protein
LRVWEKRADEKNLTMDFPTLFQEILSTFDPEDNFQAKRLQDELTGQMAGLLNVDYDVLALEMDEAESWQHALSSEPGTVLDTPPVVPPFVSEPVSVTPDIRPAHRRRGA